MQIEEIKYISTLVKQNNGLYKYQSVKKYYPLSSEQINISKEGTEIFLKSDVSGEYKITLINNEGLVFNTINYTIVGEENISRSLTRTAELDIKLEKSDANEIYIKTNTGNINATLLSDKIIHAKTDTGKEKYPVLTTGGKCELITTTGDITVRIVNE